MFNNVLKNNKYILLFSVLAISVISVNLLHGFTGTYITPQILFYPYTPVYKDEGSTYDYSMGYSIAIGYDFSRTTKAKPFRVDIEYLGNISITQVNFRKDYILLNAYYDIHFFNIPYVADNKENSKPKILFSTYIGFNFGVSVLTELNNKWYEQNTLVSAKSIVYRNSIIGGLNAGFVCHLNRYIALDLGYKWLISPIIRDSHEILLGARFTIIKKK